MRLKLVTTFALVIGFLMLLGWPFILKLRPHRTAPKAARISFYQEFAAYTGGMIVVFIGAGVGSILVVRQAQREYREATLNNLQNLVEGSLASHGTHEGPKPDA